MVKGFINPSAIAGCLISLAILGIGTMVHREMKGIETRMWMLREGFLNEVAHLAASTLSLALTDEALTAQELQTAFESFEHLDAGKYYDIAPTKEGVALQILVVNAKGLVLYDSSSRETGRNLSANPLIASALMGQHQKSIENRQGMEQMSVAVPLSADGKIEGAVRVSKPAAVLLPILKEAQANLLLGGVSGIGVAMLVVLLIFLLLLKPLELWFAYAGLFKNKKFPDRPRLRRTQFGRFGEILDHMYQSLSGRSYVEDVLSTLSHELKSPMTSIRGVLRILESPVPDSDREQFLTEAHQQMNRVQSIMDRMMALASLEKRNALKELQPIQLRETMHTIAEDLKPVMRYASVAIHIEPFDDLTFYCDEFLIKQGITNLILNAIEHSPPDSLVSVSILRQDRYLEIDIRDQGEGLPEASADQIFDKFYSSPRQQPSPNTGTGLGLHFVRQIVELHYGDVSVTNHPEGGVLAQLRFPQTLIADSVPA